MTIALWWVCLAWLVLSIFTAISKAIAADPYKIQRPKDGNLVPARLGLLLKAAAALAMAAYLLGWWDR